LIVTPDLTLSCRRTTAACAKTMSADRFLVRLSNALVKASQNEPPRTADFALAMDEVLPVFDHLGT
jgi:hypothetical protein